LLNNEFNNAQAWSDSYVNDRSSMRATDLTMSSRGLKDDEEAQKILRCGQFLAQMFASGTFKDDVVCR
jgi:sulfur relay (sulfurtransferase) complex TusBCD TusD component (DsrE family)